MSVGRVCSWAFLGFGAVISHAEGAAWTAPKGRSYQRLAIEQFDTDIRFGEAPGFERFRDTSISYYAEYGIIDDLTATLNTVVRNVAVQNAGAVARNSGLGDAELGLRYNFIGEPVVLSAQITFKAPYFYNSANQVPLGNGQEDVEARLLLGRNFGRFGYANLEAAYRFRAGDPADEARYLAEYGADVSRSVYARVKLDVTQALGATRPTPDRFGNPDFPLSFDLGRVEATLGWRLNKKVALESSATFRVFGDNALGGIAYQAAIVLTL